MARYGLSQAPVFKEAGDINETSPFGEPRGSKTHKGVDVVRYSGGNTTAYITAIAAGKVTAVKNTVTGVNHSADLEGNYVCIDHGGMVSKYFHLKYGTIPASVRVGQTVTKGTVIGYMGNTGDSYGAHLHFQLEKNGVPIDGTPYLKGQKVIGSAVDSTLESDLDVLVKKGIINSPLYWKQKAPQVQYLEEFIHNVAEAVK